MKYRTIYECDCCGSKFEEPTYDNGLSMGFINYTRRIGTADIDGKKKTLGINGVELCLCEGCLKKLEKALKEMGFRHLYSGCTSYDLYD